MRHASPPASTVRVSVVSTAAMPAASASARARVGAGEEQRLRGDFGLDRVRRDDGDAEEVGLRRLAGPRVDQVMQLAAAAPPAAPVAARRGERGTGELERQRAAGGLDAHRPGAAARGDVAAGVDETRACEGEQLRRPFRRVALADPAEIDADAGIEHDPHAVDGHAPAGHGGRPASDGVLRIDVVEGPVVSGRDEGVVDGRIETAAGPVAGGECELDDAQQVRTCLDRPVAVQLRQLGVVAKAREQRLEPVELRLGCVHRVHCVVGVDEQLHLGAHGMEGATLHHDVLVTVSGGSVTTRTDPDE